MFSQEHVKNVVYIQNDVIKKFTWLLNAFLSDFFVKKLWVEVKPDWWDILKQLEPHELATLLCEDWNSRLVWPLSLLAYRGIVLSASLSKRPTKFENYKSHPSTQKQDPLHFKVNIDSSSYTHSQYLPLEHCYRKHVKPKKQHEILQLAQVVHELTEVTACRKVIDVGGGHGHLSRLLSFGFGIETITLDAAGCHNPKAQEFDREVVLHRQKKKKRLEIVETGGDTAIAWHASMSPQHFTAWIEPSVSVDQFLDTINKCRISQDTGYQRGKHGALENTDERPSQTDMTCHKAASENVTHNEHSTLSHLSLLGPGAHEAASIKSHSSLSSVKTTLNEEESTCCENCENLGYQGAISSKGNSILDENTNVTRTKSTRDQQRSQCCEDSDEIICTKMNEYCDNYGKRTINTSDVENMTGLPDGGNCVRIHEKNEDMLLTGLHACGDLTTTLLRLFVQCPQVKGIAAVGCCYMKLTTDCDSTDGVGFPMSSFVKSLPNHHLSYEALEMACHFIDAYSSRLKDKSQHTALKSHCYRAALQEVVQEKDPDFQHGCIKFSVKNLDGLDFKTYAQKGLNKLGLDPSLSATQLERAEERLEHWKEVVAFYTLRLSLAPLVESFILLDRWLYLHEHGIDCSLIPIFDPKISPRNVALIARKQ